MATIATRSPSSLVPLSFNWMSLRYHLFLGFCGFRLVSTKRLRHLAAGGNERLDGGEARVGRDGLTKRNFHVVAIFV